MALRRASSLGSAGSAAVGGSDAYPRAAIDAARPPRNDDAAAAGSDATSGTAVTAAAATTAGVAATRADVLHRKVSMKAAAYAEQRAAAVAAAPVLEDLGDKSRGMDIDRWRKKVGITAATRVFIITGEYPDIRDALVARGWKQNPDKESPHFDMKWTLKSNEISHGTLLAAQYANHCQRATCITTKAGLTHTIRVAHHFTPVDYNTFFPRAYDLGDPQDYADFVDDFRGVEAEKVVRGVILSLLNALLGAGCISLPQLQLTSTSGRAGGRVSQADQVMTRIMTARAELLEKVLLQPAVLSNVSHPAVPLVNHGVLAAALSVCRKRQREWDDADLDAPGEAGLEPAVTAREWEVLRHCSVFREGAPVEQAPLTRADEEAARALELAMNIKRDRLIRRLAKRGKTDAATLTAVLQQSSVSGLATLNEEGGAPDAAANAAAQALAGEADDGEDDADDDVDALGGGDEDDDESGEEGDSDDNASPPPPAAGARRGAPPKPVPPAGSAAGKPAAGGARGGAALPAFRGGKAPGAAASRAAGGWAPPPALAPAPRTEENPDEFNNGTSTVAGRFRDRGAVSASMLSQWRQRLVAEGGDPAVYSDAIGNPAPTLSQTVEPAFARLTRMDAATWTTLVRLVGRINDAEACQVTLTAVPPRNVWIVKPAGKSRGRGIECERTLHNILSNRGNDGQKESQWIVMKYLERPLLIHGLKWDIRQWVMVTSWNPLTIWMFDRCYLRFCCYPFELDNLSNRYIHLSNNSIQKHSAVFDATSIAGNMWHMSQFAEWLQAQAAQGAWDDLFYYPDPEGVSGTCNLPPPDAAPALVSESSAIWADVLQPQMRRIVAASLQSAQERMEARPRSFEIYGFDFMVDADLRPWLIEINASPDFSYSTKVTETLVKEASEDAMKVVLDYGEWAEVNAKAMKKGVPPVSDPPATGGWQCIFQSAATVSRTMTCTAHSIACVGTGLKPPTSLRHASSARAVLSLPATAPSAAATATKPAPAARVVAATAAPDALSTLVAQQRLGKSKATVGSVTSAAHQDGGGVVTASAAVAASRRRVPGGSAAAGAGGDTTAALLAATRGWERPAAKPAVSTVPINRVTLGADDMFPLALGGSSSSSSTPTAANGSMGSVGGSRPPIATSAAARARSGEGGSRRHAPGSAMSSARSGAERLPAAAADDMVLPARRGRTTITSGGGGGGGGGGGDSSLAATWSLPASRSLSASAQRVLAAS